MSKENVTDSAVLEDTEVLEEVAEETADAESPMDHAALENARLMEEIELLKRRLTAAEEDRSRRERELKCFGILEAAGLPLGLADVVQSAKDMEGAAQLIKSTVRALTEEEISRRCRSDAPAVGTTTGLSREDIIRMPVAELQRIYKGK